MSFDSITAAGWHGSIVAALGVQAAVVALLAWSTVAGRDLWPFSHYPMFAPYENPPGVRAFRLRLRFADGHTAWLDEHATDLAHEFTEVFEKQATIPGSAATSGIDWLRAFWRRAGRRDPRFASLVRLEVIAQVALIAKSGAITLVEKEFLTIDAGERTSRS